MKGADSGEKRVGQRWQWSGLAALAAGFCVELIGALLASTLLFKAGLFLFLMGIPSYLIGTVLARRR